jgi:hypothetical protein
VSLNRGLAVRDRTDLVTFSDVAGPPFDHSPPIRVNGGLVDPATLPLAGAAAWTPTRRCTG